MDTLEQELEPAGSDDVTSSPDTSVTETQTVDPSVTTDDGTPGNTEAPEVKYAGKYTSPEELEKGYKELESKLGTVGPKAAIADLIQEQYGMTPEQFRAVLAQEKQQKDQALYQANPGAFAVQKVQDLENRLAYTEEKGKLDAFVTANPEYAPFKDQIFDLGLHLYNGEVREDKSYEQIAKEMFGEAMAKGQQGAYKKIETKKMTQPTSTQSQPAKRLSEQDFDNMSAAEMEKVLPWADTSYRPY
jgi:hypothetical protein